MREGGSEFRGIFFDKAYWQRWLVGIESLDEKALRNLISDEEVVVIHDEIDKKSHVFDNRWSCFWRENR